MDFKKILFKTNEIDVEKALPDAVIFCEKNGKIQWANEKAAEVFLTSKMHLLTSNISDFIENALNLITNAVIYDKKVIAKYVSAETYFDLTAKEIDDGYVIALRDTEQTSGATKISHQVKQSDVDGDKNAFLVKLSNDFKSPLQSIVGFSQAMADGLGGNMTEQQEKYIRIIKKNSADLMYFIEKLIDLSKTESCTNDPEYKTFDLINLANSIVRFNTQLTKDKDIRWSVNTAEDMKNTIISDENVLKLIIQNILEVILKAVDMGEISINISVPTEEVIMAQGLPQIDYVLISIVSSSLLLSENDLVSMFNPYKIVDSANRKNVLRAMTLGCAKNLVQSLRGIIWVESKILKNTSFNILIPNGTR